MASAKYAVTSEFCNLCIQSAVLIHYCVLRVLGQDLEAFGLKEVLIALENPVLTEMR